MKKIIISILIVAILATCMIGCSKVLDNSEGYSLLQDALAKSLESTTYYVKEKVSTGSDTSIEKILNVQADNPDTTLDDLQVMFTVNRDSLTSTISDTYFFTPSLHSSIKPSKAKDEDYKFYQFTTLDKAKTMQEKFAKDALTTEPYSAYTVQNILAPLASLKASDIEFVKNGLQTQVKLTFIKFKVINSDHPYSAYKSIEVHLFNGKIIKVGSADIKAEIGTFDDNYKIDITYQGPKMNAPRYNEFV